MRVRAKRSSDRILRKWDRAPPAAVAGHGSQALVSEDLAAIITANTRQMFARVCRKFSSSTGAPAARWMTSAGRRRSLSQPRLGTRIRRSPACRGRTARLPGWAPWHRSVLSVAQRAAANARAGVGSCISWIAAYRPRWAPRPPGLATRAFRDRPAELRWNQSLRPALTFSMGA